MKTRSLQTTGVEFPGPGSSARQRTLSVWLHFSGRFFSVATPSPDGPRQLGQLPANDGATAKRLMPSTWKERSEFFIRTGSEDGFFFSFKQRATRREFPFYHFFLRPRPSPPRHSLGGGGSSL